MTLETLFSFLIDLLICFKTVNLEVCSKQNGFAAQRGKLVWTRLTTNLAVDEKYNVDHKQKFPEL